MCPPIPGAPKLYVIPSLPLQGPGLRVEYEPDVMLIPWWPCGLTQYTPAHAQAGRQGGTWAGWARLLGPLGPHQRALPTFADLANLAKRPPAWARGWQSGISIDTCIAAPVLLLTWPHRQGSSLPGPPGSLVTYIILRKAAHADTLYILRHAVAVVLTAMALVDYSSSDPDSGPGSACASDPESEYESGSGSGSGSESESGSGPGHEEAGQPGEQNHHRPEPPPHHPATTPATATSQASTQPHHRPVSGALPPLPPLPPSFHDLYASTVRAATADLPSLHQGRRRTIPHKEGNWPSHIYVEWHPSSSQHQLLQSLLAALARDLGHLLTRHGLAGFLTSDLGAPLPLHVSLSRPFVLRTHDKDTFLDRLIRDTARCNVPAFALACCELAWHRSPDSERSFLVLRVRGPSGCNDELSALLCTYNRIVASYGQPELYAPGASGHDRSNLLGDAFHVSIAWSFTAPTAELIQRTADVFSRPEFRDAILSQISIPVDGVKVKIGNVVNNIALPESGRTGGSGSGRRLSCV